MFTELRAIFFLVVSFVFFLIIIGLLGLNTIMGVGRWSERTRAGGWPILFITLRGETAEWRAVGATCETCVYVSVVPASRGFPPVSCE